MCVEDRPTVGILLDLLPCPLHRYPSCWGMPQQLDTHNHELNALRLEEGDHVLVTSRAELDGEGHPVKEVWHLSVVAFPAARMAAEGPARIAIMVADSPTIWDASIVDGFEATLEDTPLVLLATL